jgi:hypothetical protein
MDQPTTTLPAKPPTPAALPTPPTRLRKREDTPPPQTQTDGEAVAGPGPTEQPAPPPAPVKRQRRQAAKKPATASAFGFERRVVVTAPAYELGSSDEHVLRVEPSQLRDVVLQHRYDLTYDLTDVKVCNIPMTLDELRKLVAWGSAYLAALDES